ncbi:hypothetical protein QWY84_11920 [Aquisalimonas lutea]|uniref:helix-turn-helix transcriptional regulator n=1 Tax=Aquisalimonas lutea TaxID=1327750 RepID=UPI0025B4C8AC|nr:hypothetical protein [Aquisalimonas lutea]MDN3518321.1 hypothetical protein [Aquisalimonas lutea]
MTSNRLLNLHQVARRHGIAPSVMNQMVLAGKGPPMHLVNGTAVVTENEADAWAARQPLARKREGNQ